MAAAAAAVAHNGRQKSMKWKRGREQIVSETLVEWQVHLACLAAGARATRLMKMPPGGPGARPIGRPSVHLSQRRAQRLARVAKPQCQPALTLFQTFAARPERAPVPNGRDNKLTRNEAPV